MASDFEDFMSKIPVIGGFFDSKESDALLDQYKRMQQQYQAFRPVAQQARMQGMQQVLGPGMTGPIQAQMAKMYGPGANFDLGSLMQDPLAVAQGAAAERGRVAQQDAAIARALTLRMIGWPWMGNRGIPDLSGLQRPGQGIGRLV